MYDELCNLDDERLMALENLVHQKEQVARFYNKKVNSKVFSVSILVWKVIYQLKRNPNNLENGPQLGKVPSKSKRCTQEMLMQCAS